MQPEIGHPGHKSSALHKRGTSVSQRHASSAAVRSHRTLVFLETNLPLKCLPLFNYAQTGNSQKNPLKTCIHSSLSVGCRRRNIRRRYGWRLPLFRLRPRFQKIFAVLVPRCPIPKLQMILHSHERYFLTQSRPSNRLRRQGDPPLLIRLNFSRHRKVQTRELQNFLSRSQLRRPLYSHQCLVNPVRVNPRLQIRTHYNVKLLSVPFSNQRLPNVGRDIDPIFRINVDFIFSDQQ